MSAPDYPELTTRRLRLRRCTLADAPEIKRLAGEKEIAATTENIPHPYTDGDAETWINTHGPAFRADGSLELAIERLSDRALLGIIGLLTREAGRVAEIGYWIGKPYWNCGYASEAATRMVKYGLKNRGLVEIYAACFDNNIASQKVLSKAGLARQAPRRTEIEKWGVTVQLLEFGIHA
jgi:RimJ/RimL family protein N-acetyltransferase